MCKFKFDLLVIYLEFYLINFCTILFFFQCEKFRKNQKKIGKIRENEEIQF